MSPGFLVLRTRLSEGQPKMGSSPLLSASSVSRGQEIPEHGGQLFSEAARSGDGFELPVDVLSVTLLANADSAHNYDAMLRINTVDHPM
ncbi:MAG: hypothetical protein DMG32_07240, partial [Acidobacteria bacterium]